MIHIRYLNPTGMFSYGRVGNLDLSSSGLVHLVGMNKDTGGGSNGSGKSSLFNALCEILFGENPTEVSGDSVINDKMGCGMAGRVEFVAWEGITYRVTYCRKWKEDFYPVDNDTQTRYSGTTLYLDKWVGDGWVDCRTAKMTDTREEILKALGISYSRFLSVSYMNPRTSSLFLRGKNSDRVDILSGVTGVEEWDTIYSKARAYRLSLVREVTEVQKSIAYDEGSLAQLEARIAQGMSVDWSSVLERHYADIALLGQRKEIAERNLADLQVQVEAQVKAQAAAYESTGAGKLSQEISDLSVRENQLRNPAFIDASLPQFDTSLVERVSQAKSALDLAKGGHRSLVSGTGGNILNMVNCPTCGSEVSEDKKASIRLKITELEAEIQTLFDAHEVAKTVFEGAQEAVRSARQTKYEERLIEAQAVGQRVAQLKLDMKSSSEEYERITGVLHSLSAEVSRIRVELSQIDQQSQFLNSQVEGAKRQQADTEALIQSAEVLKRTVTGKKQSISDSVGSVEVLDWFISNIPFIKLHRMSVAMVYLSERVNAYLVEMGDTIRVNISSFEAKKSSKGAADMKDMLKSEIKVEVVDGSKNIDPRLYSEGETAKISNAIIRGLYDAALTSGHGSNILLLDEIFSYVDPDNAQKVSDSFKQLRAPTTLVTDNSGHVCNLMRFDATWIALKQNGMTTLEI